MPDNRSSSPPWAHRIVRPIQLVILGCAILGSPGCTWMQNQFGGEGFQPWAKEMGQNVRDDKTTARHSGFFPSTKSQEIEESLGGGFN